MASFWASCSYTIQKVYKNTHHTQKSIIVVNKCNTIQYKNTKKKRYHKKVFFTRVLTYTRGKKTQSQYMYMKQGENETCMVRNWNDYFDEYSDLEENCYSFVSWSFPSLTKGAIVNWKCLCCCCNNHHRQRRKRGEK